MKFITSILFLFISAFSFAADHSHEHSDDQAKNKSQIKEAACENRVDVKVNGLVCDFCARSLEKVFKKQKDVSGIQVNLDAAKVIIEMKPGKMLDDATYKKLITNSGYNVVAIQKGCHS